MDTEVWCLDTVECAVDISRLVLDSLTEDTQTELRGSEFRVVEFKV